MATSRRITLIVVLGFVAAYAQANPLGLVLTRLHAPVYVPGTPVEIVVTVEAATTEGLLAMGVYETLPEGWRFEGVNAGESGLPAILPAPGDGPRLEFAWIAPPPMPCSFSYTAVPPEDSWGVKEIHGVLEYRMQEGPYYLPDTVTALDGPREAKPTLMLRGAQEMEIIQGDVWEEPGYTALDTRLQDISSRVVVTGEVRTDTPGTYTLRYSVVSESGRQVTEVERIVRVLPEEERDAPDNVSTVSGSASGFLPEIRERIMQKLAPEKTVALVDEGEATNADGTPRTKLHLPNPDVLRPVVPDQGEQDAQEAAMDLESGTLQEGEPPEGEEDTTSVLLERGPDSLGETNRAPLEGDQEEPVENSMEQQEDSRYRYALLGLAGFAAGGVITGAWFVLRGGRKRRHSLAGVEKKKRNT